MKGSNDGCIGCAAPREALPITFAFQPIVQTSTNSIISYEALVRGVNGEAAEQIIGAIDDSAMYNFDQRCRTGAIELAARLGMSTNLNINFLPNAVYRPEVCIQTTLQTAGRVGFPIENIVFEVSERERVIDRHKLRAILEEYQRLGFASAIDDFGAGYAGLDLLTEFQPDFIKLDIQLVRNIDRDTKKQAIVRGVNRMTEDLGIALVAEGVETGEESTWLRSEGIDIQQGFFFARPAFETLPSILPAA